MRRVVITGMGAVTPVGNNVNDMWEAVKAGKCGIDKITHLIQKTVQSSLPVK